MEPIDLDDIGLFFEYLTDGKVSSVSFITHQIDESIWLLGLTCRYEGYKAPVCLWNIASLIDLENTNFLKIHGVVFKIATDVQTVTQIVLYLV